MLTNKEKILGYLRINNQARESRVKPKNWAYGFNTYKLSAKLIKTFLFLHEKGDDILMSDFSENGKILGYISAINFNKENYNRLLEILSNLVSPGVIKMMELNFSKNEILTISANHLPFWKMIKEKNNKPFSYTFGFQIAVEKNSKRRGVGKFLMSEFESFAKKNNSTFIIVFVEIYPSFNLAQFEFLFKKQDYSILGIVETNLNTQEKERCIIFFKPLFTS